MTETKKVVVVATPTSPLLPNILHSLSHSHSFQITVLTRETSISIATSKHKHDHHHHDHKHTSKIQHIKTTFSDSSLAAHLKNTNTVICHLTGSDIHLIPCLITSSVIAGVSLFIPSEYGLDTSNPQIRSLLPPYQTRFDIQNQLRTSGLKWTAIYSGLILEEALKTDGALGIDCLWGSVVHLSKKDVKIPISSYEEISNAITKIAIHNQVGDGSNEVWTSTFKATLKEIVSAVEMTLDREFDVYEGNIEDAKREAGERMKGGYFDGVVALMGKVAVWDDGVDAWAGWQGSEGLRKSGWEEEVGTIAVGLRSEESGGGGGCGC